MRHTQRAVIGLRRSDHAPHDPTASRGRAGRARSPAAAALADFRRFEDGASVQGDWALWAGRLAAALSSVLEMPAPVLDAAQLATLGQALADAIEYRQPSGLCADCESHPAGLCSRTPPTWTGPTPTGPLPG